MQSKFVIATLCTLFFSFSTFSQEDKDEKEKDRKYTLKTEEITVEAASVESKPFDPLSPSTAAFYSAVLPGLGQAYNKKYWKIPIIYAALGTSIYFYIDNNNEYHRYRDAYKRRLAGFKDDEFYGRVTDDGLRNAQKQLNKNREISILVTIGIYALNIIDANVDAHLLQYNVDDNLSLRPHYKINEFDYKSSDVGLTLNFQF
ncbi:DUF5683 domain-containing protein [Yeosuana sp. MJ-SS3]|uniref:DUF5683 domain-containing protein n=1 Tax=Gilvirhabdus luticola TaxID=3079858 RepID=A0ABU3U834_9FLAO|nr:DUF5683 domain-containing protein [Yeosuana sp. MJ-SS3]MDU8886551.1 DUF5683 domain-containing protein [Yeosuana sp. MJ-SS3]